MFGGPDTELREAVKESGIQNAAMVSAILQLLIDKEVLTFAEFEAMRLKFLPVMEQQASAIQEQKEREWREDHPKEAGALDLLNKLMGGPRSCTPES